MYGAAGAPGVGTAVGVSCPWRCPLYRVTGRRVVGTVAFPVGIGSRAATVSLSHVSHGDRHCTLSLEDSGLIAVFRHILAAV